MPPPANWFIALPFPAEALSTGVLTGLPGGTRALHAADLHVTVAFLGPVGENRAARAWASLTELRQDPIPTHLGGHATFGPPARPSALGLDLDAAAGDGALTRFIEGWRDPLRGMAGASPDPRQVRPHVTLGRPPRRPDPDWPQRLSNWLAEANDNRPVLLDRIALYTRNDGDSPRRFRQVRRLCWTRSGPIEENMQ